MDCGCHLVRASNVFVDIMGLIFGARAAEAVAENDFGKMIAARGIAPACELSLVDISVALGKIDLKNIGM